MTASEFWASFFYIFVFAMCLPHPGSSFATFSSLSPRKTNRKAAVVIPSSLWAFEGGGGGFPSSDLESLSISDDDSIAAIQAPTPSDEYDPMLLLSSGQHGFVVPFMPTSISTQSATSLLSSFHSGQSDFVSIPNFLSSAQICRLQEDIRALKNMGFGSRAGIASKHLNNQTLRRNVHQIWLQSPMSRPADYFAGCMDARRNLLQVVESLRQILNQQGWTSLPPELLELSYLWYDPGAFYFRHADTFAKSGEDRDFRRTVSMILFLGDPTNQSEWNPIRDGGCLRVHREVAGSGSAIETFNDISPDAGTLVLFDSATIPHEVMETFRTRACIVGWFNSYSLQPEANPDVRP